ncbi:unnamed protein product [Musa acuminata subsp. burmannicoides]
MVLNYGKLLVAVAFSSLPLVGDDIASEEKLLDLYERWQSHHGVSRSVDEKRIRFDVFKENANYVFASNKKAKPYKLSLNKFGDTAREEFKRTYAGTRIRRRSTLRGRGSSLLVEEILLELKEDLLTNDQTWWLAQPADMRRTSTDGTAQTLFPHFLGLMGQGRDEVHAPILQLTEVQELLLRRDVIPSQGQAGECNRNEKFAKI